MSQGIDAILERAFETARTMEPAPADVRAVIARSRRRRRFGRGPALILVGAALVAGGGAVADILSRDQQIDAQVTNSGPLPSSGEAGLDRLIALAKTKKEFAPIAATFSIEGSAPDPKGGPEWVLVVWRTQTGGWCTLAARRDGDKIGGSGPDGQLLPFPFQEGNSCSTAPLKPDDASMGLLQLPDVATIVSGIAGPDVAAVNVTAPPEAGRLVPSPRGGILAVLPPRPEHYPSFKGDVELRDGSHHPIGG
jgi:hypothetical protein